MVGNDGAVAVLECAGIVSEEEDAAAVIAAGAVVRQLG